MCTTCLNTLSHDIQSRNSCPRCAVNPLQRSCSCDFAWDYPFDAIYSFTDYTSQVQALMHTIKYRGMRSLATEVGRICATYTAAPHLFTDADMIIPVPLHKSRFKKRGYNQAAWFARGIKGRYPDLTFNASLLVRTRATVTQTALDRSDRHKNVEGAFTVPAEFHHSIFQKHVLLVDDVITTGATTSAATEALLRAGCSHVTAVSFARD